MANDLCSRVTLNSVAPYTGARIETGTGRNAGALCLVAPYTGARIETPPAMKGFSYPLGRPLHGGAD